jgi:hypothetical protein
MAESKKDNSEQLKTFDDFMRLMLKTFPNAEVDQDLDGQLMIYTGLTIQNGEVTSFEPED